MMDRLENDSRLHQPGVEVGPPLWFTHEEASLLIELVEDVLDELRPPTTKSLSELRSRLEEILKYIRNNYPPTL